MFPPLKTLTAALLSAVLCLQPLTAASYSIAIEFREAIEVAPDEDKDLTYLHRITFDDDSLDWATLDHVFEVDDIFNIRLDEAGTISIKVESVEQGDDYIIITGIFEEGVGWAQILYMDEKLCIILSDYQDNEIYHIVYNEIERCYTVRITEPDAPKN